MEYASFGSVSTATLRNEDLLDAFASELEYQIQRNADEWCSDDGRRRRDKLISLVGEAREIDPDDEDASEIVSDLIDALQEFAPPYAYFGALEGDGADFRLNTRREPRLCRRRAIRRNLGRHPRTTNNHEADKMARALRSARLMLYAWRGVRRRDGLPEHRELDETIREVEAALEL